MPTALSTVVSRDSYELTTSEADFNEVFEKWKNDFIFDAVLLAGTNDMFTAFNADNRFGFDEWQFIEAANKCGVKITPVPDEEYYSDYHRMLGDPKINARLQGLMTNDRPDIHGVETENKFTANILYRLGFSWTLPDKAYIERVISGLVTLGYFDADNTDE